MLKVSVVVTVKDDEAGIGRLISALELQTIKPDEIIIIRAEEHGNCSRGKGRNIGVRRAKNEMIAVTDAGCRPRRDWLEKLIASRRELKERISANERIVWAGWYRMKARTELQRIIGRFLTTGNPTQSRAFLPASRSIMFTKKAWGLAGGYPEEAVSGAEDLEFARRLAAHPKVKMIYCPEALVDWEPPATLTDFFRDIVKHTRGNVEVGYLPHLIKNFTVVLRWAVFAFFPWMIPVYLVLIIPLRIHLGIRQGESFSFRSLLFIPIVQLAADAGVVYGLILGVWGRITAWDIKI